MSKETTKIYTKEYYENYDGGEYERGGVVFNSFMQKADTIVNEINPKSALDIGCAKGFMVEGLRDRGVEAYGIDISDYAVSMVRDDLKPFCRVASATDPLDRDYDLITCIEVLEHLKLEDIKLVIKNICEHCEQVIFSSTPSDFEDDTHISVQPIEFWAEQFAYYGFYHDVNYNASYISPQTLRFRKTEKDKYQLIREYEQAFYSKFLENNALHYSVALANERIRVLDENNIKNGQIIDRTAEKQREIEQLKNQLEEQKLQNEAACCELNEQISKLENKLVKANEARNRSKESYAYIQEKIKVYEEKYYYEHEFCLYERDKSMQLEAACKDAEAQINSIRSFYENTRSWKITKPLRGLGKIARKILKR